MKMGAVCMKIVEGLHAKGFETRNRGNLFVSFRPCLTLDRVCSKLNRRLHDVRRTFSSVKTGSCTLCFFHV